MNRDEWPVTPRNHTVHCAVFMSGPYSYEKGPTGPPVERVRLGDCTCRNAWHRGVAWYSVVHSSVHNCTIENTDAEGIDLDHFCYHCDVSANRLTNCRNVELNDASWRTVTGNTLTDTSSGIVLWKWCTLPALNVGNLLARNRVVRSRGNGIHCRVGADRNDIMANTVESPGGKDIVVEGKGNRVLGNLLSSCLQGGVETDEAGNVVAGNREG